MIWILTAMGAFIRFWKINHGLPHIFYSDEGHYTYFALNMGGGDLNPHDFFHPSFYYYLYFLVDVAYIAGSVALGIFKTPGDSWELYRTNPTIFYTLGRSVSAALGTLTLPVTYWIGKKMFNKTVAWIASFFLCFSLIHVQFSQIGNMDVPLTFFIALTFLLALDALEKGKTTNFILCGLVGGFSAGTKYQGLETLIWGPLACFLLALEEKKNPFRAMVGWKVLLFFLFFALGFTITTPYWILDFDQFKNHFLWTWSYYKNAGKGQLGYEGYANWFYYLEILFSYGMGLFLTTISLVGLGVLLFVGGIKNIFFVSFPFVYFLIAGFSQIRAARYILPVIPFLSLAGAFFLVWFFSAFVKKEKKMLAVASCITALFVASPNVWSTIRYAYFRLFPDTRNLAAEWISKQIPPRSRILQSAYAFVPQSSSGVLQVEPLDFTVFNTRTTNLSSLKTLEKYRREGFQYLILDEWHKGIILSEGSRFPKYSETVERYQQFLKHLDQSAELSAVFSPYREENIPFDMENVEVPSRLLSKMKSTGPTIWIYKL
jgi:hypothetical protein